MPLADNLCVRLYFPSQRAGASIARSLLRQHNSVLFLFYRSQHGTTSGWRAPSSFQNRLCNARLLPSRRKPERRKSPLYSHKPETIR
jgi:hypothetical protein